MRLLQRPQLPAVRWAGSGWPWPTGAHVGAAECAAADDGDDLAGSAAAAGDAGSWQRRPPRQLRSGVRGRTSGTIRALCWLAFGYPGSSVRVEWLIGCYLQMSRWSLR